MLSVIVYGRNDNHGYNLHKRCAISLNCIAQLLDADGDEIVFVDYNTPDDMPTFIEAIGDTLTRRALSLIRVLRVRPHHHARIADKTHLVAVEPIARNVAIRRSNPDNRWILSTNTDMIFVPRSARASLSQIISQLDDGFYHLPRFELPEALWESCRRTDPAKILSSVRRWSNQFHLDEVVFGNPNIIYDGPGDFQLALREDLFKTNGFDERMLLGWHLDSNIAKRFRLLRGGIETALPYLKGYHCDHTRQATIYHRRDRVENDSVQFVYGVDRFDIPEQAETWGLTRDTIEEYRLDSRTTGRYLRALGKTIGAPKTVDYYETFYDGVSFDRLEYPLDHVLPYLLDALYCIPSSATIGYLGCRTDTLRATARALEAVGFTGELLLCHDQEWFQPSQPLIIAVPFVDFVERADMFVVEVGIDTETAESEQTAGERLASIFNLFDAIVRAHEGTTKPPKKVVGVNVVNNQFERLFNDAVSATLTPYSSRVRHGLMVSTLEFTAAPRLDLAQLRQELSRRLGRTFLVPTSELKFYREELNELVKNQGDDGDLARVAAVATPLRMLLSIPDGRSYVGIDDNLAAEISDGLAKASSVHQLREILHPLQIVERAAAPAAATRLADINDWDDKGWCRLARRFFGDGGLDTLQRKPWTWERVSALYAFTSLSPQRAKPNVLVVAHQAECLAVYFSKLGAAVDILNPMELFDEFEPGADWSTSLPEWAGRPPTPIRYLRNIEESAERYDFVVFPQNALFFRHVDGIEQLMTTLSRCLKSGGYVLAHATVCLDHRANRSSVSKLMLADGVLKDLFARHTTFVLVEHPEASLGISAESLERSWFKNSQSESLPSFVSWEANAVQTRAQLVLRKIGCSAPERWDLFVQDWSAWIRQQERKPPQSRLSLTPDTSEKPGQVFPVTTEGAGDELGRGLTSDDIVVAHQRTHADARRTDAMAALREEVVAALASTQKSAQVASGLAEILDSALRERDRTLFEVRQLHAHLTRLEEQARRACGHMAALAEKETAVAATLTRRGSEIEILGARVRGLKSMLRLLEQDRRNTDLKADSRVGFPELTRSTHPFRQ